MVSTDRVVTSNVSVIFALVGANKPQIKTVVLIVFVAALAVIIETDYNVVVAYNLPGENTEVANNVKNEGASMVTHANGGVDEILHLHVCLGVAGGALGVKEVSV